MLNVAGVHSLVDWRLSHVEVQASLLDFHNNRLTNPIGYKYIVTKFNCKHLFYEKVQRLGVHNLRYHTAMSQGPVPFLYCVIFTSVGIRSVAPPKG